jgi:hypothetical protein
VRWFRWQTNAARLTRTSGARGVLSFDSTLPGGELRGVRAPQEIEVYSQMYYNQRVKESADKAIADESITSRGSKLLRRREITMEKYETETDVVKEKVKKRYRKVMKKMAKARKDAKAGIRQELDAITKVKYVTYRRRVILSPC